MSIAIRPPTSRKKNECDDVLDPDHLVVGVDAEVVLPRVAPWPEWSSGRVGRPGPSRTSSRSAPSPTRKNERRGEQRDLGHGVAVEDGVVAVERAGARTSSP